MLTTTRWWAILLLLLQQLHHADAILPDGLLVPFTSKLPACASLCGVLSDVQGGCVPPVVSTPDQKCFCGDARLTGFVQGPEAVSTACNGAVTGCTNDQFQTIEDWYSGFCGVGKQNSDSNSNSNSNSNGNSGSASSETDSKTQSSSGSSKTKDPETGPWIKTHWKWLVMLIFVFGGLAVVAFVGRYYRKRYLRKQEMERRMRAPTIQPAMATTSQYTGVGAKDFAGGAPGGKKGPNVTATPIISPAGGPMLPGRR